MYCQTNSTCRLHILPLLKLVAHSRVEGELQFLNGPISRIAALSRMILYILYPDGHTSLSVGSVSHPCISVGAVSRLCIEKPGEATFDGKVSMDILAKFLPQAVEVIPAVRN